MVRQVPGTALDSQLMEGITHLEHPALGVSLDSRPMEGSSCLEPVEQSILLSSWTATPRNCVTKQKSEWKLVITPAISYTLDSRPMEGIAYLDRPALGVSLDSGPTEGASCLEPLEQSVLSSSLAAQPIEESSAPMIDSDLSIVNWEDRFYRRSGYGGGDSHDVMNTDSSEPDVWKRLETADPIYTGRTATLSERWLDTNDNSDTDSVAELEYKTWDDGCAWEFCNALGNAPPPRINSESADRNDTRLRNGR